MDTKAYWKTKRFWGMLISALGGSALTIAAYFNVTEHVEAVLKIVSIFCGIFGVPLTVWGAVTASVPMGSRDRGRV